ncbi:hypothetical protein ACFXHA_40840 [Nocardia sp. NPDC059240]|uniref:hypothetical protein n=1 Tax=Nocardia sp. NPDC059240 TaxID=3346786 RepID=UPI0036BC8D3A
MRAGRALACEWTSHLDAEVPVEIRADAEAVVVIALAPDRVAHPVIGRVEVIGDYLVGKGFHVYALHTRTLREGVLWTSLRGQALAGVMPASQSRVSTSPHLPRLPHLRAARVRSRLLVAALAAVATLVCASPVVVASPPTGQPGLIIDPPSHRQAGLAPAAPATDQTRGNPNAGAGAVTAVTEQGGEQPQAVTVTVVPQVPSASSAPRSAQVVTEAVPLAEESVPDAPGREDGLRIDAAAIARPVWLPAPIAAHERALNALVVDQVSKVVADAGLSGPATEVTLGGGDEQPAPLADELAWAQMTVTDPQQWVPLVLDAVEPAVADLAPQAQDAVDALAASLPAERR